MNKYNPVLFQHNVFASNIVVLLQLINNREHSQKNTHSDPTRTHTLSHLSSSGHYAVFNMALYTHSCELTEGWEIADHLTPTLSGLTEHTGRGCRATTTTTNQFMKPQ